MNNSNNIIEWLNTNTDAGDAIFYGLISLVIWYILWKLLLGKLLGKCNVNSFGYRIYELGAGGSWCVLIFLLLIAALIIASIQAAITYGLKMIFVLFLFWGAIITIFALVIKNINKK